MAKCWAQALGGCEGGLSGEHIITESLFSGDEIGVKGLPWCREGYKFIGKASYTANILCRKHNSDLSPVDDGGSDAFSTLRTARRIHEQRLALLEERQWAGRFDEIEHTIDGEPLERWFLKTQINYELVGGQGIPIGTTSTGIAPDLVEIAFGRKRFEPETGLYFAGFDGEALKVSERVQYTSWIRDSSNGPVVLAGAFLFFGFRFVLSLETTGLSERIETPQGTLRLVRHLRGLNLELNARPSQRIVFHWPNDNPATGSTVTK